METNLSDVIVGLMMAAFGLIGLFMAARANDDEIYVFGLSLLAFAICFNFGLLKRHYDLRDRIASAARAYGNV